MNLIRVCLFCRTVLAVPQLGFAVGDPLILDRLACCDEACFVAHHTRLAEKLRWGTDWMMAA